MNGECCGFATNARRCVGDDEGARSLTLPSPHGDLNEVPNIAIGRSMARLLELVLNGRPRTDAAPDNLLLLDYLREIVGLTGTKTGCDGGECGACTVLVDDQPRLSCLTLAAQVDGQRVETVESL